MILKMEKLSAACLLEHREALLPRLQRAQCIQLRPAEDLGDFEEIEPLTSAGSAGSYEQEQALSRYSSALAAMSLYAKKRGMFTPKPSVAFEGLGEEDTMAKADALCTRIEEEMAKISATRSQKSKDAFAKASLIPWEESDLPLELEGTRTVSVLYYLLPVKTDMEALERGRQEAAPDCVLHVVSQDREQLYLLAICHKTAEEALWELLKSLGATRTAFAGLTGTAKENVAALSGAIEKADLAIAACEKELTEIGQDIYPVQYACDTLSVQVQQQKAGAYFRRTEKVFCFTAWVPETRREEALAILEEYNCYYDLEQPDQEEEPPVLLKNNAYSTPYESVTSMYSLPAYRGFDPNGILSVTYFLFFGMMLGDAGFGLILFFGGLWLSRKTGMKGLVQVITYGGLSATMWGVIFGSYFGDLITVVSRDFIGHQVNPPVFLDPINDAMLMMGICLALGMLHIFLGMGIKFYMLCKRGQVKDAIFDVGFWYVFIIGLLLMLGAYLTGIGALMDSGKWIAIGGGVGIALTSARDKKNPIMRIINGVGGLYDITSYLSDVLSYSRILALGLATGVIAQVFNIIGTLLGTGFFGAIFFIVIFAIGSALNLGINTLGAYVHTARLHYVEFFGKFYEAGGKPFTPFMAQTKYVTVTNKEAF